MGCRTKHLSGSKHKRTRKQRTGKTHNHTNRQQSLLNENNQWKRNERRNKIMIIRFQLLAVLPCDPLPVALLSYKHTAHTDPSIPLPKLPILVLLRHLSTYCRPAPGRGQCSFANSRAPLERPCSITVRAKPVAFGRNADEEGKRREMAGRGAHTQIHTHAGFII